LRSVKSKKGKAIPVTGRGGPKGCEMSRLPHFLDSWPQCSWMDLVNWKIQWPHREWNPRPSGL
jgi:hypothetical protein